MASTVRLPSVRMALAIEAVTSAVLLHVVVAEYMYFLRQD